MQSINFEAGAIVSLIFLLLSFLNLRFTVPLEIKLLMQGLLTATFAMVLGTLGPSGAFSTASPYLFKIAFVLVLASVGVTLLSPSSDRSATPTTTKTNRRKSDES